MDYLLMLFTHLIKSAEFFTIEGLPNIPITHFPYAVSELIYNIVKIIEIYLRYFQ